MYFFFLLKRLQQFGRKHRQKQQTLYFDCAKHINYKKIYIYMYIQHTISVNMLSMLVFWKHGVFS